MHSNGAGTVFAPGCAASAMLTGAFACDLTSFSAAADLGVGDPSGEGHFRGGQVDLQDLAGSHVHWRGGPKFGVPLERWTSILTWFRSLPVVFSTVPTKALEPAS